MRTVGKRALLGSCLVMGLAVGAARPAAAADDRQIGVVALYGWTTPRDTRSLGGGELFNTALALDLGRWRSVLFRAELFPLQVYREAHQPGPGSDHITASAACFMGRVRLAEPGPGWELFGDLGTGPFYAYRRPLPRGGSRGNFYNQIGVGLSRATVASGTWSLLARWVHVSNARLQEPTPGYSFFAVGLAWSTLTHRTPAR